MKQMLLVLLSAICFHASSQPTITNSYFPTAGDTLRSGVVQQPDASFSALITAPGGPYTWDLSNVVYDNLVETVYQDASAGTKVAQFPGSDLVIIGTQGETYFNTTATQFQAMGYSGADPGGFGLDVVAKFSPLVTERKATLNFFDIGSSSTNLSLPFSVDQLPDSLFSGLPIAPDSIRVRVSTSRVEVVNAYGKVLLPGANSYDVLRQQRTEYTTTGLDLKVPFLGWIDISTLIGGGAGGGLGGFIGTDTTVTYRFYANNVKEEVAVLTLSNDQSSVQGIRFKATQITSGTEPEITAAPGSPSVTAFPNPAVDWVRFDYHNLPEDDYRLKIYTLIGNAVWDESYHLSGSKFIRLDLDKFRKGTYLYSLANKKGEVIGTKRLVILKP